jgi:hypothetical protein
MTDLTDLENAYNTVVAAEKQLVQDITDLAAMVNARLVELRDDLPSQAANTPARQFLNRVDANLNSLFTYDLESVRTGYGMEPLNQAPMNSVAAPTAPVAQTA